MTQQATTTKTVRLVESFTGNAGQVERSGIFYEETSNRLYQTLDGHHYVVTSWADDPDFGPNAVVWDSEHEAGTPTVETVFRFTFASEDFPHADGPDTDETHEAALAAQGYSVQSQEEAA